MMNDPKDPFVLTRGKVFLYGTVATAALAALAWIYVPAAPRDSALSNPLAGPGSERAKLGEAGDDGANPQAPSAPAQGEPGLSGSTDAASARGGDPATGASAPSPGENATTSNSPAVAAAPAAAPGSPEANYTRFCAQCHGEDGQANTMMSRMMTAKVPNLVKGPFGYPREAEVIAQLVLKGSSNKAMPGFERELGEAGARALAEHVLKFPETKAPKKD